MLVDMPGVLNVLREQQAIAQRMCLTLKRVAQATHLVWATSSMVPEVKVDRGRIWLLEHRLMAG